MNRRLSLLTDIARQLVALPDRTAHGLLLRDAEVWIRVETLGLLARTGIASALLDGGTLDQVAARAEVTDRELLAAVLALGVAVGEVRERDGRYGIRGRRLRAIAGESDDLAGLVEECHSYSSRIYLRLGDHLRGEPPADYLAGMGGVIARASRLVEPVLGATVRSIVASAAPSSVLDVGCGSGTYLRHVGDAAPGARILGIDADEGAVTEAKALVSGRAGVEVRHADLDDLDPATDGPFDLVLLLNNLYYWSVEERAAVLERLHALAPTGAVVVAIAVAGPGMPAGTAQLDVELRVTQGCHPTPTSDELDALLAAGPFTTVERVEPIARLGLAVAVCS